MRLWQREEDKGGQLEATMAAREDGCSLRSHDGEEEWAMMTWLRAGRQQRQRRRQRVWSVMAAAAVAAAGEEVGQRWIRQLQRRWPAEEEAAEGRNGREGLVAVKKGLAAAEAARKRRRQRGLTRAAAAGEQRGPARKRERKVRRARLEQRPRRGMAGWKWLRLLLRRRGDGGWEEEAAGSCEGCGSGIRRGSEGGRRARQRPADEVAGGSD
ncbi:hypothetical protein B296_00054894 [Ensete ventricosum]|uniref:Uncharacterized protein n=1 Tax=Ensete ventricosum TaxID=4639 RepID=A0A426XKS7_ENSVE|nr:hypothetical protein B296_00054894 [Ensete ventricosum]